MSLGRCSVAISLLVCAAQQASAVGILEKMDLEVKQGGTTVFSMSGIDLTGNPLDGSVAVDLGALGWNPGTHAKLWVSVNDPAIANVANRWVAFRIDTGSSYMGSSLLDPNAEGKLTVSFSNMVFDLPNPAERPSPITPQNYAAVGKDFLPLYYMMGSEGFLNLPGSHKYGPNQPSPWNIAGAATPRSVQTPLTSWLPGNPFGYGFTDLTNAATTGYRLAGIPDTSGTNPLKLDAPTVTYINGNSPLDFYPGVFNQLVPGVVPEIGSCLQFKDVPVPEPTTLLFLAGGLLVTLRPRRTA